MKAFWRNVVLLAVFLLPSSSASVIVLQIEQYGDSDRYALALSWQTGFCQNQHDRNRNERSKCRLQTKTTNRADFLTMYGLRSELSRSVVTHGADEHRWMRFGCATRPIPNLPEVRASRMYSSPETRLSLETAAKLNEVALGTGRRSCLEHYEYARHGTCFSFDPDAYFGTMVHLSRGIRESEAGKFLADDYGKTMSCRDSDTAFAKSRGKENVKTVRLACQGDPAYLTETRISIKANAINVPLFANLFLPRPYPDNCGKAFVIDKAGY